MDRREDADDSRLETRRVVWCVSCGRSRECSAEEMLNYTRRGWPRCCGGVMAFITELATADPFVTDVAD